MIDGRASEEPGARQNPELSRKPVRTGAGSSVYTSGVRDGEEPAAMNGGFARSYFGAVPATIVAGTAEIERKMIATRGLGRPRD